MRHYKYIQNINETICKEVKDNTRKNSVSQREYQIIQVLQNSQVQVLELKNSVTQMKNSLG
jgi:hypothetical protein